MAVGTLVLSELFHTFLICTYVGASQTTDYENERCSCAIPGTKLYAGVYYEIRLVTPVYAGWPLVHSSWAQKMGAGITHYLVAVDPEKNETLMRDGQTPAALHWRFVETEQPGWYHLQNKNHPDKYITWSMDESDRLYWAGWRLVLDPNFPGQHNRMDFFVRPYRPRGVDIYIHQLKFKTRPIAVVSWSSMSDGKTIPIQLDMSNQDYLEVYEPDGMHFEDSLFEFREVKENTSATFSTGWINTFSCQLISFLFLFSVARGI